MREILFRGKRTDNGEWVEGYYVCDTTEKNTYHYIFPENTCEGIVVIPETVGQYGLTDKNGKKIFEGDIVDVGIKGNKTICKVAWADNVAQFQLWQKNTVPRTSTNLNLGNYDCEVIGNICDNPELLKGE